jgi:hypothetical protein
MSSFFKRNQKKMLAIFSAGLMIAFALPSAVKDYNKTRDVVIGYVGKAKVTNKDLAESHAQWELLKNTFYFTSRDKSGQEQKVSFVTNYFAQKCNDAQAGADLVARLDASSELFHLLTREAEEMGVFVSNDEIQNVLRNVPHDPDTLDSSYDQRAADAVRSLLLVTNAADQAAGAAKVSRPFRDLMLASRQQMSLNLVSFNARDYLARLPVWSDADKASKMTAQFEKYKNLEPATRPADDFSFGYKVPNQAQIQYIELPGDAMKKAVVSKITDVDVRKYFYQHIDQFAATQPASQPATAPATGPSTTQTASATAPSTSPVKRFETFQDEALKRLTEERTLKLVQDVLADINTQMNADYAAFKASIGAAGSNATTAPSIAPEVLAKLPPTSLGVPYTSYEYLQKLALRTQVRFGVVPITHEDRGLRTDAQIAADESIAKASFEGLDLLTLFQRMNQDFQTAQQVYQQITPFISIAGYSTHFVGPLAEIQIRQLSQSLRMMRILGLYEPSPLFRESAGMFGRPSADSSAFIFRAVAAEPAHAPRQSDVAEQVLADAKLVDAYKMALDDAAKFIEAAKSRNSHLAAFAKEQNKPLITTELLGASNIDLKDAKIPAGVASQVLVGLAYNLLNGSGPDPMHPVGTLESKAATTAFAAEINQLKPQWTPDTLTAMEVYITAGVGQLTANDLRRQWFSMPDVAARLHFVPTANSKNSDPS